MWDQTKMLIAGEGCGDKFAHPIYFVTILDLSPSVICIQFLSRELKVFKVLWGRNPEILLMFFVLLKAVQYQVVFSLYCIIR